MSGEELDAYMDDVRRRPLVIRSERPRYEWAITLLAGSLLGHGVIALIEGWPWWWAAISAGLILETVWWFGIASEAACARRYERARIAAIRERRAELGLDGAR